MLANQILQKIIGDIHQIIKKDCSIWDTKGECLVQSSQAEETLGKEVVRFLKEANEERSFSVTEKAAYFAVFYEEKLSYVFAVHSADANIEIVGRLPAYIRLFCLRARCGEHPCHASWF